LANEHVAQTVAGMFFGKNTFPIRPPYYPWPHTFIWQRV
jgi:hypothetical protein